MPLPASPLPPLEGATFWTLGTKPAANVVEVLTPLEFIVATKKTQQARVPGEPSQAMR
ncbi:hypothetical protein [Corallococcus llansteffanensis]|uniref:hypothetical protein n=1 Tax=Corallococcus llansteffanensis TaxID=2316731 RepID=UPI0013156559|nr:hypothetical protein [Corallococcus llansteffanensis]